MATPIFHSNWPTFPQRHHNTAVPPPSDNYTLSDTCNNNPLLFNYSSSFNNNNLQFHSPVNYPSLSSAYNPIPITAQQQLLPDLSQSFSFSHGYYSVPDPILPDACDVGDFFAVEPMQLCIQPECYSYPSYPVVPDVYSMEQVQPELPPFPEIYDGGSSSVTATAYSGGAGFNFVQAEEKSRVEMKENGDGRGRLSAQSMAARVRRRKISEKTLKLGKLVPGGHRMTTAEMFQAAFKYIKFLQAQAGVLQLMPSELVSEVQALLTSPSVEEKLYAAGKCIATQSLKETLADGHQGTES